MAVSHRLSLEVDSNQTDDEEVRALLSAIEACAASASSHDHESRREQSPAKMSLFTETKIRFAELRAHLTTKVAGKRLLGAIFVSLLLGSQPQ